MDKDELMYRLMSLGLGRHLCPCWHVTTWDGVHADYCGIKQLAGMLLKHFTPKEDVVKRISDGNYLQFGYYIGHYIEEIPMSYLDWILSDFPIEDEEDSKLFEAARAEKDRRIAKEHHIEDPESNQK